MINLKSRWASLSPGVQRVVAWGAGGSVLLLLAAIAVQSAGAPTPRGSAQDKLVRNLLTDTDPRSLGIEGLAARLERMEQHVDDVKKALAKPPDKPDVPPVDPAVVEAQRVEMAQLKDELESLRRQMEVAKQTPPPGSTAALRPPGRLPEPATPPTPAPAAPAPAPPGERPMDQMFSPPTAKGPSPAVPGARASGPNRAMDIRVVSAPPPPAPPPGRPAAPAPGELFIPAGSILTGVLLNGLDAPTGQGARQQPTPALVRIKHDALLPNRFRADVKECFVIVGGFGDLGSERAYLRAETLTCVRTDGGVIEVPLDAYAVGEDGKVGVRGRLVSKQGALLAKALQAGFLTAFSKVFTQVPATPFSNATTGGQVQFQSMFTPQAAEAGFAGGVGGAMDKLADYYMKMAENTFPVLEVDAGRGIELIINKGTSLKLK
ncbi:TrbI/VirB10 family protein [uncultured Thiodictyon sp.]|uniref:TrbI/VirB10 family protein n=1 Tax=uncultured Thiodictyon sp. TaxID=1846217 RepID=UPI0025E55215|nr:TrbI/VirB10 family protein [uncultured Thiodictyon sp.]